jgi:hypothetical protein
MNKLSQVLPRNSMPLTGENPIDKEKGDTFHPQHDNTDMPADIAA